MFLESDCDPDYSCLNQLLPPQCLSFFFASCAALNFAAGLGRRYHIRVLPHYRQQHNARSIDGLPSLDPEQQSDSAATIPCPRCTMYASA